MAEYGYSLYYPYIHIHDDNWLKLAALYNDGLKRIVPEGCQTADSHTARVFQEELDFIQNLAPEEVESVASEFLGFVFNQLADGNKRRALLKKVRAKIPVGSTFLIHSDKMSEALRQELPEVGLARKHLKKSQKHGSWYEFESITGALYLTCLANRMAANREMPLVSDDPVYQPLVRAMQSEFDPEANTSNKGNILASLVIESVTPTDIEHVSAEAIVRFRRKHDDERRRFYDAVSSLAKDMPLIDNREAMNDCLNHYKKRVDDAVNDIRGALTGIGISCVTGLLGLSVPSWSSALALAQPSVGLGVVAFGLITVALCLLAKEGVNYRSRYRSPWASVLSLERGVDSRSVMQRLFEGTTLL